jgi:UDP-glucose 4-epimerase
VAQPLKYYGNNTCSTRSLLQACLENQVKNFVFSSTAAVYGMPEGGRPADEESPTRPINAYGTSKLMSEWMLRDVAASSALRYVALRYFNVAGSDPEGRIGQATPGATLLTKVACEAMVGKRPHVSVFGSDYPTPDGTGVRDYLHVEDLAAAHLNALDYLRAGGKSVTLNVGYGHGYSVREVLQMVETVGGSPLVVREEARRSWWRRLSAFVQSSGGARVTMTCVRSCRTPWRGRENCCGSRGAESSEDFVVHGAPGARHLSGRKGSAVRVRALY